VLHVPKSSFQAIRSPDAAKYHKDLDEKEVLLIGLDCSSATKKAS
jgi:hypothetical protein